MAPFWKSSGEEAQDQFQLTEAETKSLRSQTVIAKRGGTRYLPYAFTEQGVAMLSSVLRSPRAVAVNVEIMRAFVRLRRLLAGMPNWRSGWTRWRRRPPPGSSRPTNRFNMVFDAIRELIAPTESKQARIGFRETPGDRRLNPHPKKTSRMP